MEIFKGNYKPKERGKDKYHEYGNTGGLLLRLCIPLFITGKVVILDSGFFCVTFRNSIEEHGSILSCIDQEKKILATICEGRGNQSTF